jgi:hypothetical protein
MPNNHLNSDCQMFRRSFLAMQTLAAGYVKRYPTFTLPMIITLRFMSGNTKPIR